MYTLGDISERIGAELRGDPSRIVKRVSPIDDSCPDSITFLTQHRYKKHLLTTQAGAVLLTADAADACPVDCLVVKNSKKSFISLVNLFEKKITSVTGIHATAVVSPSAIIHPEASIGPHCVIGDSVVIGSRTVLQANCVVMSDCAIGSDCTLFANVTLYKNTRVSDRVIIHSSAVLGADGFGNVLDGKKWVKIPHLGGVYIGSDVEIGASTTIDRGVVNDTIIEDGVKIDNQVHLAHNVRVGENTVIAGCVGIAGSTIIGKQCVIAGAVKIVDNISIADGVIIQAAAVVLKKIEDTGVYGGAIPAQPVRIWHKLCLSFFHLADVRKRIKKIERSVYE
jgi:UDP-3-O-[3-hydroxymyristoyl] glucosamine N-acyltransferase